MRTLKYLNTDLELESAEDLRPLTRALCRQGLFTLHVGQNDDGLWFARMETQRQYRKPNSNINAIIGAVERLGRKSHILWERCAKRQLDVGYCSGDQPRWLINEISVKTLRRMAQHSASLAVTLYPPFPDDAEGMTAAPR